MRVILDQHPFGMFGDQQEAMDRLIAAGVEVQWGQDQYQFTHAKYMVIDGRVALIMNQNLTRSAFEGNREYGVVTTEPNVVDHAQSIFEADWDGSRPNASAGPLVVSPENSRERITRMISEAATSIDFYAELIRDTGLIETLQDAVNRGVSVRLIVNATVDPEDLEALVDLSRNGVEVRMMESLYIHSKTMIFDIDSALIGSHNYTMTSLDRNRELGIVINDKQLVSRVVAIYERDSLRAIPAEPVALVAPFRIGLADIGIEPVGTGNRATLVVQQDAPIIRLIHLQSPTVLVTQ